MADANRRLDDSAMDLEPQTLDDHFIVLLWALKNVEQCSNSGEEREIRTSRTAANKSKGHIRLCIEESDQDGCEMLNK